VEAAKALGSSFKLVTLAPKRTVRAMTQLPKETQKNIWGHNQIKGTTEHAKHKLRLS